MQYFFFLLRYSFLPKLFFFFLFSSSLYEEIAAIPIPSNLKLHETSSICNRTHETLPLAQRLAYLQNKSSTSNFLPGLFCTSCKVCIAVYKPEDLLNCHSTNSTSHYKSIEDILQSSDYNKVHSDLFAWLCLWKIRSLYLSLIYITISFHN